MVQNSDFSKNSSFSAISPVQIMVGVKFIKKAMFAVFIIYDWVKKIINKDKFTYAYR